MKKLNLVLMLIPLVLLSCSEKKFKEAKVFAGNKTVSAETLNLGHLTYTEYCVSCHGVNGDGKGVASKGMYPPPRNFTLGLYKFGNVASGEAPHDKDFYRIIRHGLNGTAMLKWDISDKRLDAVTQYIKTFAPQVWENKEQVLGEAMVLPPDPYANGYKTQGIQIGKEVYHTLANCQSCHSAYATKAEMLEWAKRYKQDAPTFDETLYVIKPQDSDHGYKSIPPDFTWHEIRSANNVEEIALRLASGVGGTSMPSWKGVIEDDQLWAVAYYVQSLMELKNTPQRDVLFTQLKNQ